MESFTESPDKRETEFTEGNSQNIITNHIEDQEEISPLPELTKSLRQKQKAKSSQDIDNQLDINTLPNCVFNRGKESVTDSVEKETFSSDHTLQNCVNNCGKQSVAGSREGKDFPNNHDQQKATSTPQTLANDSDIHLMEQVKKHRHQDKKLEFLIKWLGYSNRENTWESEDHFSPGLVQKYFQQFSLEKPTQTNKVFMTKILAKGTPITWRCHIPRTLVLLCLFVLWSSLTKTQPGTVPILNLGPLYDCCQPRYLGIFGFPSLKNCHHNMLQQETTVSTFLRYSPVATTFSIYYCPLETITMTCHYDNIFARKSRYRTAKSVQLPGRSS